MSVNKDGSPLRVDIVTIFPEYLTPLELSLVGKAKDRGLVDFAVHNLRDWATDKHRTVDDTPYGGGAGMVMRPDVWGEALDDILAPAAHLLIPSPAGRALDQRLVEELATEQHLVIACGRYEGIDARVVEHYQTKNRVTEFSIGDYVLNGGEVAALVAIEAIVRLLPGVVGNPDSVIEESHNSAGTLEAPVYTKPANWRGYEVPAVLLSGHHAQVGRWRAEQSLRRTADIRPDLLNKIRAAGLSAEQRQLLAELRKAADRDSPG